MKELIDSSDELLLPMDRKKQKKNTEYSFLKNPCDKEGRSCSDANYDNSSLHIPDREFNSFTNIEQQYWKIKQEYFDTIVFFQKGKFYELFENDALIANRLFSMKLTERAQMKMCGFPISSYEIWARKFLEEGYKIARVDQKENSIGKKLRETAVKKDKIIERSITEIVTPSTSTFYDGSTSNLHLASVYFSEQVHVVLYCPIKNSASIRSFTDNKNYFKLHTIFLQYNVKEVISNNPIRNKKIIRPIYNKLLNFNLDLEGNLNSNELIAYSNLIHYLTYLKKDTRNVRIVKERKMERKYCEINNITIENLIINSDLVKRVDMCVTAAGTRLLRDWIYYPYYDAPSIIMRQEIIEGLGAIDCDELHRAIKGVGDLERLLGKLNGLYKNIDLYNLHLSLQNGLSLLSKNSAIITLLNSIEVDVKCLCAEQKMKFNFDLSYIDLLRKFAKDFSSKYKINKESIEKLLLSEEEKELYGKFNKIKIALNQYRKDIEKEYSICTKYVSLNKDIYQMEIENQYHKRVPPSFILISNTKNCKRYYTAELKKLVEEYKEVEELIFQNKEKILYGAVQEFKEEEIFNMILKLSHSVAEIDAYISVKKFNGVCGAKNTRPKFICEKCSHIYNSNHTNLCFEARELVHPLYPSYISNSIEFLRDNSVAIMTGPNMGGKSTLLRTIGLSVILAQCGYNVYAEEFISIPFDKIFSRLGASDNIMRGQSTFEIEMLECADMLNYATKSSLLLIDELGRGTSVKDGEAICQSVLEYIIEQQKSLCVFSTHYHRMIERILEWKSTIRIVHMKYYIEEDTKRIVFQYKIGEGVCKDSQGIAVARLAGIPDEIIEYAEKIKFLLKK